MCIIFTILLFTQIVMQILMKSTEINVVTLKCFQALLLHPKITQAQHPLLSFKVSPLKL